MTEWEKYIAKCKKTKFWNDFIQTIDDTYKAVIKLGWKEKSEYYSQGEQMIKFKKGDLTLDIHVYEADEEEE